MGVSLKKELKKAVADVLKNKGMPVCTDKSFASCWEAFAKSQPSALNSALTKVDPDIWGSLAKNLEKFIMKPEHAAVVVPKMKKIFGDTPEPAAIKEFMQ